MVVPAAKFVATFTFGAGSDVQAVKLAANPRTAMIARYFRTFIRPPMDVVTADAVNGQPMLCCENADS